MGLVPCYETRTYSENTGGRRQAKDDSPPPAPQFSTVATPQKPEIREKVGKVGKVGYGSAKQRTLFSYGGGGKNPGLILNDECGEKNEHVSFEEAEGHLSWLLPAAPPHFIIEVMGDIAPSDLPVLKH